MLPCCSLAPLTVGPVALMVNAPGHPATSQQVARPTATRSAELRTEGQTVGVRSRSPGAPEPRSPGAPAAGVCPELGWEGSRQEGVILRPWDSGCRTAVGYF